MFSDLRIGQEFAAFEAEHTPVPRLVGMASGVVLEIGPGSGNQLSRFDQKAISHIYGIEPNKCLFDHLCETQIKKHGLTDVYTPIHAALENEGELASAGIMNGSIDTIVCMQVLCSVSDPIKAVKRMHELLKPGGQLLLWEHTANKDTLTRHVQGLWNILWSPFVGGCRLNRDIEELIFNVDWHVAEKGRDDQQPWHPMPRFWGRFLKP
ncbi:S-adenosyl-L-methionine-dependent methyltransferase [Pyrenochaeta sp. MPI-SDFR-AT-0127]|nr:S-adenosyl-L-methionine-dependent methyltransferase [Pyrenochaeta sp. MPI-SDFR-AT-0127]